MQGVFQLSVEGFDSDSDIEVIGSLLAEMIEMVGGPEKGTVPIKVLKSSLSKSRLYTAQFNTLVVSA